MTFSSEEIRMLAKLDRDMDSGKVLYVLNGGERWAVNNKVIEHFKLQPGQTVSNTIIQAILEFNIKELDNKIAEIETEKAIDKMKST